MGSSSAGTEEFLGCPQGLRRVERPAWLMPGRASAVLERLVQRSCPGALAAIGSMPNRSGMAAPGRMPAAAALVLASMTDVHGVTKGCCPLQFVLFELVKKMCTAVFDQK